MSVKFSILLQVSEENKNQIDLDDNTLSLYQAGSGVH